MSIIHHLAVLCPCESSELSISNMGRIRVTVRTRIYIVLFVLLTFHISGKKLG